MVNLRDINFSAVAEDGGEAIKIGADHVFSKERVGGGDGPSDGSCRSDRSGLAAELPV
jgi:hypothetical protein